MQVTHNTINIGKISQFKKVSNQNILLSTNSTIHEQNSKPGNTDIFQYYDESKTEVASITNDMRPLVKLEMCKKLSANEKKLLLCCAMNQAQVVYTIHKRIPQILPISITTCSCPLCEECRHQRKSAIYRGLLEKLYVRAAGYSRIKNLVYFDVFPDPLTFVIHTVECTPRDNQRGIVKLVINDDCNDTLWTAVQFPGDIFAFYTRTNNLLGYQWKNLIFDDRKQKVMSIEKRHSMHQARFEQGFSQRISFDILDNKNSLVAIISKDINCTSIFRPRERAETNQMCMLERIFAIPLAVKMYSGAYKMDEWPLPEITYHYKSVREPGKRVF